MSWPLLFESFLARSLVGALAISLVGVAVASVVRQPARQLRVLELTIVACLITPFLTLLPGLPRWTILPETMVRPLAAPVPTVPIEVAPALPAVTSTSAEPEPRITVEAPQQRPRLLMTTISWNQYVLAIYLGIACCFALRWMVGVVALARLIRASRPAPESLRERLVEVAGPGANRLQLRLSDRIEQPIAASVLRPTILIPQGLVADGDPVSIRCAIAHEWSHIERRDLWTWYLASLALIPFFALPTFWWLRRKIRLCQDYLADARASAFAPSPEDYADFLIRFAGRFSPRAIGLGLGDRGISLRRRIEMLITPHEPWQDRCSRRQTVAFTLAASALILAVGSIRLDAAGPPLAQPSKPSAEVGFTGTVVDSATSQPIADARVIVRILEPAMLSGEPVVTATTDAEGRYRVTVPGIDRDETFRTLQVSADHPRYALAALRSAPAFILKDQPAPNLPTFTEIKLDPAQPTSGQIVRPDGKPATGVVVAASWAARQPANFLSLSNPPRTGRVLTKTDEQGRFQVKTPAEGNVRLEFISTEFVLSSLSTNQRGELNKITLKSGLRLKGIVLDSEGKPLKGVGLRLNGQGPMNVRQAETDAEGRFTFDPVPPGAFTLQPTPSLVDYTTQSLIRSKSLPGAFRPMTMPVILKEGEEPAAITIKAVPHINIEVRCVDGSGKPIVDQNVTVMSPPPSNDRNARPPVTNPNRWTLGAPSGSDGLAIILAPRGPENALLAVMPGDQRAVRYEDADGRPIPNSRDGIVLKDLDKDVKGVTVRVYRSPKVVLKFTTRDGVLPKDLKVAARYDGERPAIRFIRPAMALKGIAAETDRMALRRLDDGRLQLSSIVPGSPVTISASAEGFRPAEVKATLAEGESKDVELILERL